MDACSDAEVTPPAEQPLQPKEEEQQRPLATAAVADITAGEHGQHAAASATTPRGGAATHGTGAAAAAPLLRLHIIDGTGNERRLDVHAERDITVAELKRRHWSAGGAHYQDLHGSQASDGSRCLSTSPGRPSQHVT